MKGKTNAKNEMFRGFETLNITTLLDGATSEVVNGSTITITDANTGEVSTLTYNGEMLSMTIPTNHTYIVKAKKIDGYMPPEKTEYVATKDGIRKITLNHQTPPAGVFICNMDGELIAAKDWTATDNENPLGIYVGSSTHRIVIPYLFGYGYNFMYAYPKGYDNPELDFDGLNNTYHNYPPRLAGIDVDDAVEDAWEYKFPHGKQAYSPALGEALMIHENKVAIQEALDKCSGNIPCFGGNAYNSIWTSTGGPDQEPIYVSLNGGYWGYSDCYDSYEEAREAERNGDNIYATNKILPICLY